MTKSLTRPMRSRLLLSRTRRSVLTLAVLAGLFAGATCAQVFVTDKASIANNQEGFKSQLAQTVEQYTKQGLQYAKQLDQYRQEVQQYEQLLMTVQGLGTNISLTQNKLTQITDPSALIDQNCPGASGGSVVGSLVTSLTSTISLNQPITASQQQICANIVTVQIDEYNKTVIILNQLNDYGGTLQKLNKLANDVNTLGTTSGATTQATTFSATMAQSMSDWQTSIAGDDALIKSLNQQQQILAKVALNGSNTILGNVVQATALKAAFTINQ
ncbi:MAG: hypothetical protein ABI870_06015 [Rhodanobacter sp.]